MATHKHDGHVYHVLHDEEAAEGSPSQSHQGHQQHRLIKMIGISAALSLLIVFAWAAILPRDGNSHPSTPLRFTKDGTFHISVFADLHFGESTTTQRG